MLVLMPGFPSAALAAAKQVRVETNTILLFLYDRSFHVSLLCGTHFACVPPVLSVYGSTQLLVSLLNAFLARVAR